MARQVYCQFCHSWIDRLPKESATACKKRHAVEHRQDTELFDRLDVIELDLWLVEMYGGSFD
jgi:hypothetical protein